jgi:hypothetical protein
VSGRRCLVVGVVAIGFVESRSDSTTSAAQRQPMSAELKPTDIRRRFSQRLRFIISVSAPMESGLLVSHRESPHCSPRDDYCAPILKLDSAPMAHALPVKSLHSERLARRRDRGILRSCRDDSSVELRNW